MTQYRMHRSARFQRKHQCPSFRAYNITFILIDILIQCSFIRSLVFIRLTGIEYSIYDMFIIDQSQMKTDGAEKWLYNIT